MKYRTLKRFSKDYDELFSTEKETATIEVFIGLSSGECNISITEQQCDLRLAQPHITIYNPDTKTSYSMDFDTFLSKIAK